MGKARRHPSPRQVKIHRSYSVAEVAELLGIHRNTVRHWINDEGLPVCDGRRPVLILGTALRAFLEAKRRRNKRTCKPGEIYCMRCRQPQSPALGMVDYKPVSVTLGMLVGLCPVCGLLMHRLVSPRKLAQVQGNLEITQTMAPERLGNSGKPIVNSDFR